MTPPTNTAAWLPKAKARLQVGPAPYTPPGENELVVKTGAVAVNPVEWSKQLIGDMMFSWIKYPFILGNDLAGEVVAVGTGPTASRFQPGDRVLAHALAMDPAVNRAAEGAFQAYVVVRAHMAAHIPDSLPYERACVLPLCLSTAACGLFQKDYLALQPPIPALADRKTTGEVVLVWGGSTSVGSNAVQLAAAAGYVVIATASPRNFDYLKTLGATHVFDYRAPTVVDDIVAAIGPSRPVAGALAVGNNSTENCIRVLARCKAGGNRFVAQASFPWPESTSFSLAGLAGFALGMAWWNVKVAAMTRVQGVKTKFIFGSSLMGNEVSKLLYEDFLPRALEEGTFVPAPEPLVVGTGLESVQHALDVHKKGVSAKKVVVTI
ncbi:chaperonin 10-like protein [Podospora appendiculata]|uniref:Chaperonin 10-like protein n=1 Tax=Podospora appendiculata TaxID=314037 RepID=A0AAE0X2Q1_9PEZI|nr:chaperonin 10-like protein [Podospora appendiculata]